MSMKRQAVGMESNRAYKLFLITSYVIVSAIIYFCFAENIKSILQGWMPGMLIDNTYVLFSSIALGMLISTMLFGLLKRRRK